MMRQSLRPCFVLLCLFAVVSAVVFPASALAGGGAPVPRGLGDPPDYRMQSIRIDLQTTAKVNLASGNLFVSSDDLSVKGIDIPFVAEQEWNSLEAESGHVQQWYDGVPAAYERGEGAVEIQLPHYDRADFQLESGAFVTPPGIDASLCAVNGSTCTGNAADGKAYTGASAKYALTFHHNGDDALARENTKVTFNASGLPLSDEDHYGNAIVYHSSKGVLTNISDTVLRKFVATTTTLAGGSKVISGWKDEAGKRTITYGFGSDERESEYTDAASDVTKYGYDESGQLHALTDPRGHKTEFAYDAQHRVTSITQPEVGGAHPVWKYEYYEASSSHGHACTASGTTTKTVVTDPNGHASTYCANAEDQVVQSFDPLGDEKQGEYTPTGQVASFQAPGASGLSKVSYDALGNATALTDPTEVKSTASYDDRAFPYQATSVTSGAGSTEKFCRAGEERTGEESTAPSCPSASGQPAGAVTAITESSGTPIYTYEYESNGLLKSAKDQLGNVTTYTFDSKGDLTKVAPPVPKAGEIKSTEELKPTTFKPDADGRMESMTDGNKKTTKYTYTPLDELQVVTFADGSTMTYNYDADGNLISRVDSAGEASKGTGTTEYEYDALNRVVHETLPSGATNAYSYDAVGNLTSLADSTGTTKYAYNQANELTSLAEPGGSCEGTEELCSRFTYNTYGAREKTNLANGDTIELEHDAAGRLLSTKTTSPEYGTLISLLYKYEGGLIHSETNSHGDTVTYHYDGRSRLFEAVDTGTHPETWKYEYDANGDRTSEESNGELLTYAYNADSEPCWKYFMHSSASCGEPPSSAETFTYDHDGNLTGDSYGDKYAYNDRNQMSSLTVKGPGGETPWEQSFGGIGQSELTATGPRTFQNNILGVGITHGGEWGDADYVHEPNGALFSTKEAGRKQYFILDALGSVVAMASVKEHEGLGAYITYNPFGSVREDTRNMQNYFWFQSGYPVGTTGEDYPQGPLHFGERFYSPEPTGTWTQRDSILHPAEPAQYDPYVFVGDDPVNRADRGGRDFEGAEKTLELELKGCLVGGVLGGLWAAGTESVEGVLEGAGAGCVQGAAGAGILEEIF